MKYTSQQIQEHIDALAKPQGSLGRLEEVAHKLALIQQTLKPQTKPRIVVEFAGDHGVTTSNVSPWPPILTTIIMNCMKANQASSSVLAKSQDCDLRLVDVGSITPMDGEMPEHVRVERVAAGTKNFANEPAMSVEEFDKAYAIGADEAKKAVEAGYKVLITGEMGIGNTTPAAALTLLLADAPSEFAAWYGANATDEMRLNKLRIIEAAVEREKVKLATNPKEAIAALSGFEIAAMAGFYAMGAKLGAVVLVDGYVATSAALIAQKLEPECVNNMIAAHQSAEKGHKYALDKLGLKPLIQWEMRLGEGTGAIIALGLLDAAAAMIGELSLLSDLMGQ